MSWTGARYCHYLWYLAGIPIVEPGADGRAKRQALVEHVFELNSPVVGRPEASMILRLVCTGLPMCLSPDQACRIRHDSPEDLVGRQLTNSMIR
jgi:hypothetical protein